MTRNVDFTSFKQCSSCYSENAGIKLLPNVKFIDPYADPDVNTIRNADVVWMQTNAMPHSRYNKIMEIVRIKKIPVKYFAYASAEKCAVQLAEYDTEEI